MSEKDFHSGKTRLRPIMFVGTGSGVGKSVITSGFCRIFKQDGYHPAPFKAQNMSLNSYATPEGLEIGRAQAVQAEAAGIPCHTDMNPVLLKPTSDKRSQVILHGKPVGNYSARDYFASDHRDGLFLEVKKAFHRLSGQYNPIVLEGAGSISELNLKKRDITNMRMAIEADAAVYLIADIDRGGVFGSLYGTMLLLEPEERRHIKGIVINKFRGDPQLFEEGRKMLEELCQVPITAVLPYFRDIFIEEEDSLAPGQKRNGPVTGKVNVAVVLLNRLSNFTDFDCLRRDRRVNLFYTRDPNLLLQADIILLPGSKNTLEDLFSLQKEGLDRVLIKAFEDGKSVIGICGGFQMMGEWVDDPLEIEGSMGSLTGLNLLPVRTVLQATKTTLQRSFRFLGGEELCRGYEIHMGVTHPIGEESPVNRFEEGDTEGYFLHDKCWGTYLHGILDNPVVINAIVAPYTHEQPEMVDHRGYKEEQYDKLAALIRRHTDMETIYKTLQS